MIRRCQAANIVGETLTCSQPEITGGSGDLTINYYWQDINSKSVLYMGATQVVGELDVGRTTRCQVYVRDNVTGENLHCCIEQRWAYHQAHQMATLSTVDSIQHC